RVSGVCPCGRAFVDRSGQELPTLAAVGPRRAWRTRRDRLGPGGGSLRCAGSSINWSTCSGGAGRNASEGVPFGSRGKEEGHPPGEAGGRRGYWVGVGGGCWRDKRRRDEAPRRGSGSSRVRRSGEPPTTILRTVSRSGSRPSSGETTGRVHVPGRR